MLNIIWVDDSAACALSTTCAYEYRRCDLYVHPNWLSNPAKREINVVHEFMHIVTEPLYTTARDARNLLVKHHPDTEALMDEQIRMSIEMVTCDLQRLVMKLVA